MAVPSAWSEGFARLEALPIPRGVGETAWHGMIKPARAFLDRWGGKADALGWSAGELFGLDLAAPFGRRDRRGAAFFLADATVVAVTAEAITLRVGPNRDFSLAASRAATQSIRRREGFTAPAWEGLA